MYIYIVYLILHLCLCACSRARAHTSVRFHAQTNDFMLRSILFLYCCCYYYYFYYWWCFWLHPKRSSLVHLNTLTDMWHDEISRSRADFARNHPSFDVANYLWCILWIVLFLIGSYYREVVFFCVCVTLILLLHHKIKILT